MYKQGRFKVLASRVVTWGAIMLCVWDFPKQKKKKNGKINKMKKKCNTRQSYLILYQCS